MIRWALYTVREDAGPSIRDRGVYGAEWQNSYHQRQSGNAQRAWSIQVAVKTNCVLGIPQT